MTNTDKSPKQENVQQEQGVRRDAMDPHGHSGEGSASAMAHMISQDQKHRRQNGESGNDSQKS